MIRLIREPMQLPTAHKHCKPQFTCNVTKEEYCDIVNKTKQHIVDGDIFQAVLSAGLKRRIPTVCSMRIASCAPPTLLRIWFTCIGMTSS